MSDLEQQPNTGGIPHAFGNLRVLCRSCNSRKNNRIEEAAAHQAGRK